MAKWTGSKYLLDDLNAFGKFDILEWNSALSRSAETGEKAIGAQNMPMPSLRAAAQPKRIRGIWAAMFHEKATA